MFEIETALLHEGNEKEDCAYLEDKDVEDIEGVGDTNETLKCFEGISANEMLHWSTQKYREVRMKLTKEEVVD